MNHVTTCQGLEILIFDLTRPEILIFYMTRPCQVKECKIVLEQSVVTGWLAGHTECQPRFQFPEPRLGRILQRD